MAVSNLIIAVFISAFSLTTCNYGNEEDNPFYDFSRSSRGSTFCPSNAQCVPLASCPFLNDIINKDCILANRVSSLGCGYQGSGLVCCPQMRDSTILNTAEHRNAHLCGQSSIQGDTYDGIGSYPWVARVGFRNIINGETKYPCTGSILNRRVILTAAHCALAKADNYKLFSVRLGEYLTTSDIDCGNEFCGLPVQDIAISHVIVHPGYDKSTYKKNIAMLVLRSAINYTVTAQPICLPESWSVTNNRGILVGWGKIAGQTAISTKQQVLRLPIVPNRQCSAVYAQKMPITDENICAGGEQGNDACSGFGGAPLLVQHGETFYQVGILSFGLDQCGAAGIPSVYVNIKNFVKWIKENMPVIYNN